MEISADFQCAKCKKGLGHKPYMLKCDDKRICGFSCYTPKQPICPLCKIDIQGEEEADHIILDVCAKKQLQKKKATCGSCNKKMSLTDLREHQECCPNKDGQNEEIEEGEAGEEEKQVRNEGDGEKVEEKERKKEVKEEKEEEEEMGVRVERVGRDLIFRPLETNMPVTDGKYIWKIDNVDQRKRDADCGKTLSLDSEPFYISPFGYKMCARIYLNGDGMGKGTHVSLFVVLMKGNCDALLQWPFFPKVTLMLLDQGTLTRHLSDSFRPDPASSSFGRPTSEMSITSGCPLFVSQSVLSDSAYVKDNVMFIKVIVNTSDEIPPVPVEYCPYRPFGCLFEGSSGAVQQHLSSESDQCSRAQLLHQLYNACIQRQ